MTFKSTKVLALATLFGIFALMPAIVPAVTAAAGGNSGGCPSINAISNFSTARRLDATFTLDGTGTTATYTFTFTHTPNQPPVGGIPGLIQYCVYPSSPGNPTSAAASYDSWKTVFATNQGYFGFKRPMGDPTNIPFDGKTYTIGTASWPTGTAPTSQTILLHINDPAICSRLYGSGGTTCFVFPGHSHGGGGEGI
jgi:hypothetical protein